MTVEIGALSNGLALVTEPMPDAESVAVELMVPGGNVHDHPSRFGESLVLAELMLRGAGPYSSRDLSDAFDELGIRYGCGASQDRYTIRATLLPENLPRALELMSLVAREPHLPGADIEAVRSLLEQDLNALPDNPSRRVMIELWQRYFPEPYNRNPLGSEEGLAAVTDASLRECWERSFKPRGAVLSIAGRFDRTVLARAIEAHFGAWAGDSIGIPAFGPLPPPGSYHVPSESAQLQLAFSFPAAAFGDPDYYAAKVVSGVLSGGMFGRLFVEVREKRGLCYSVYARHSATKDSGNVAAYAGTTPERAHETLEVMLREFRGLKGTLSEEEIARSRTNLKASMVIGEESPSARAGSNASEWWIHRKVRTLEEIVDAVNAVTIEDCERYLARFPLEHLVLVTLGTKKLDIPA